MRAKTLFLSVLTVLIAGGVIYLSNNSPDSPDDVEKRSALRVDSLAADNRPSITARRDTVPEPVGEDLSPRTALIRTTILSVEEVEGEKYELTVQVEEVLGYGPSTPPITADKQFTFEISHYLKRNPTVKDKLKTDEQIHLLVSSQAGITTTKSDKGQSWSFVEFQF